MLTLLLEVTLFTLVIDVFDSSWLLTVFTSPMNVAPPGAVTDPGVLAPLDDAVCVAPLLLLPLSPNVVVTIIFFLTMRSLSTAVLLLASSDCGN